MHAITNLHWLIHSQGVPLENMPLPTADKNESEETEEANVDGSLTRQKLDPRVDRDLLQKASLLRAEYLKVSCGEYSEESSVNGQMGKFKPMSRY